MSEDTTVETAAAQDSVKAPGDDVAAVRGFVANAGGGATAVLQPVGEAGVRITLVGAEGGFLGDRMVHDRTIAQAVVEAVDGLEEGEWDRELTSIASVRPAHWRKMAGWVANQKRFPKARDRKILD